MAALIGWQRDYFLRTLGADGAGDLLSAQLADGSWGDIDYRDRTSASWDPIRHLDRVRTLAIAHAQADSPRARRAGMLDGVSRGLSFWFARRPQSANWWWNDIGQQEWLMPIGLVLDGQLSEAHRLAIVSLLTDTPNLSGANLLWLASQTVVRGCLARDPERIRRGLDAIKGSVVVTTSEGIQPDWSFHQHGPQLYNGGYGMAYLNGVARFVALAQGTEFAFSSQQIDILTSLMLDGNRWMVRLAMMDFSADGREIARRDQLAWEWREGIEFLASVNSSRAEELHAFRDHIDGKLASVVSGNRHFYRSDFMAHQRPAFYASVKMCSARTVGTESINGENIKGVWLPYGLTVFSRDGWEYWNIFPAWDWAHLPGVTNPRFVDKPGPNQQTTFVGGVSDGTYGVAAMALDHASSWAMKSTFLFDGEVVALGSGITSSHPDPVHTTLNQCRWLSEISVDGRTLDRGEHDLAGVRWVYQGGFGYVFAGGADVHVSAATRPVNWNVINLAYPTDSFPMDVFTLWLDHGTHPADQSYQYIVLPAGSPQEVQRYSDQIPVRVLSNRPELQAVRHANRQITGIVFATPGSLALRDDLTIAVDQPCLALVNEAARPLRVTLANPRNEPMAVNVCLRRTGQPEEVLRFSLPSGPLAGQSQTREAGR